jgi:DNA repair exonuclease SbcCD ATPase subunit
MEFKLITDLTQLPQAVEFNAEELKAELSEKLTYYKNLVVTEDAIREAKSDRAKLSKLRDAIDTKRKEVKKACMAPYEAFETQCKEIMGMISEPITSIDEQIKAFDQKELDAKHAELEKHFASAMAGCDLPIELDKIINPKWQNKTMKIETLRKEITECVEQVKEDVNGIKYAYGDTPHLDAVLKCYYAGYDAGAAHVYANQLIDAQRKREEQAMSAQQAHRESEEVPAQVNEPEQEKPVQDAQEAPEHDPVAIARFKATGKLSQLRKARDYMLELGIKLESIN